MIQIEKFAPDLAADDANFSIITLVLIVARLGHHDAAAQIIQPAQRLQSDLGGRPLKRALIQSMA